MARRNELLLMWWYMGGEQLGYLMVEVGQMPRNVSGIKITTRHKQAGNCTLTRHY